MDCNGDLDVKIPINTGFFVYEYKDCKVANMVIGVVTSFIKLNLLDLYEFKFDLL